MALNEEKLLSHILTPILSNWYMYLWFQTGYVTIVYIYNHTENTMKGRIKHNERYVHITMETDVSIKVTSHDISLTIL